MAKNVDYSVELHSIKCMAELYADAKTKFQTYGNVCVWPGYSEDVLPDLLKGLTTEPTLFWLDAHFPGADFGMGSYWDENQPIDIKLPLKVELETIVNNRDINGDIFVIDDLRMYKHGPYEAGDWLESPCLWGSEFIHTLLNSTHHVIETSVQQGMLLLSQIVGISICIQTL